MQSRNKKIIKWLLIIIIPLLIVLWFIGDVEFISDDIISYKFASQLYSIPLPPDTKIIKKAKDVGLLAGNSNHLDFMAYIEVESSLTKEELENYYSDKKVKPANEVSRFFKLEERYWEYKSPSGYYEPIRIVVFSKNKAEMYPDLIYHETKEVDSQISADLFIFQITDSGYSPGRDFRAY